MKGGDGGRPHQSVVDLELTGPPDFFVKKFMRLGFIGSKNVTETGMSWYAELKTRMRPGAPDSYSKGRKFEAARSLLDLEASYQRQLSHLH